MTPRAFGEKCAQSLWDSYNDNFKNTYGVDLRLPHDYHALRQLGVATALGGVLGFGRGVFWPGYHEKLDAHGNVIAKKRRSPWLGAAEGALLGAGSSALSNYAGQMLSQYNPEIDKLLSGVKDKAVGALPVTGRHVSTGVDTNQPLLNMISHLG